MIGQQKIQEILKNSQFSTAILLVGLKGSGKKTLLQQIYPNAWVAPDTKVDTIREMNELAYKIKDFYFIIPDCDSMSITAQNAMLKVVEERPNNNHFILTLVDENNILDTIRSRSVTLHMDRYTPDDIATYYHDYAENRFSGEKEIVVELCETPGEVNQLLAMGIKDFTEYVQLVVDNIAEVSGANVFKIADRINLGNDSDKYDLFLFWKAFIYYCFDRVKENVQVYTEWMQLTSKAIRTMRIKGINRKMLFDAWLLGIRQVAFDDDTGSETGYTA